MQIVTLAARPDLASAVWDGDPMEITIQVDRRGTGLAALMLTNSAILGD